MGLLAGANRTERKESPVELALQAVILSVEPAGTSPPGHHLRGGFLFVVFLMRV